MLNFLFRLADFYEKSIPYMCRQIESIPQIKKEKMVYNLNLARKFLLQIYNALLHSASIKLLLYCTLITYILFVTDFHI